jgi:hypothetical protein
MQPASENSDDSQMNPDPNHFEPVLLCVDDGSSELDEPIDAAIGVVMGLRTALLFPGDAIRRAAIAAADDWLRQFQSPLG